MFRSTLTIAVGSVMGVPRVAGSGSTLSKGGRSPIPILRPGYRVIAGFYGRERVFRWLVRSAPERRPIRSDERTRLAGFRSFSSTTD